MKFMVAQRSQDQDFDCARKLALARTIGIILDMTERGLKKLTRNS